MINELVKNHSVEPIANIKNLKSQQPVYTQLGKNSRSFIEPAHDTQKHLNTQKPVHKLKNCTIKLFHENVNKNH